MARTSGGGPWLPAFRRLCLARQLVGATTPAMPSPALEASLAIVDGVDVGAVPPGPPEPAALLSAYLRALRYVHQVASDTATPLDLTVVRSLHFLLAADPAGASSGRWRSTITAVDAPPGVPVVDAARVPAAVRDLLHRADRLLGPPLLRVPTPPPPLGAAGEGEDLEARVEVAAAEAHARMWTLAPFPDRNEAVAAVLATLILCRGLEMPPELCGIEEELGEDPRGRAVLLAAAAAGDGRSDSLDGAAETSEWRLWVLEAHERHLWRLLARAAEMEARWFAVEQRVVSAGLPYRAIPALVDASMGLPVDNHGYRVLAGVPEGLATRDLKALADLGLLVAQGERRGRRYLAADALRDVERAARAAGEAHGVSATDPEALTLGL